MNKHPTDIGGLARLEPGHDRLEGADVRGPGRPIARRPARDLPADIAVPATQVGQAGHRDVDIVQLDEGLHRAPAQPLDVAAGQAQLRDVGAQDRPDDPLHDVEGRPRTSSSRHSATIVGTGGKTGASATCRSCSRTMSCAPLALVPTGGRRRMTSRSAYRSRWWIGDSAGELPNLRYAVQPPGSAAALRSQAATRSTSKASSARTAPALAPRPSPRPSPASGSCRTGAEIGLEQLAGHDPEVHLVRAVGQAQRPGTGVHGRERVSSLIPAPPWSWIARSTTRRPSAGRPP